MAKLSFYKRSQLCPYFKYATIILIMANLGFLKNSVMYTVLEPYVNGFLRHTYPTYFISPLRLSGLAVESIFSQYKKHTVGSKLDAVNYTTARAACLIKQSVATHHSEKGYHDEAPHTTEIPLKKNFTISMQSIQVK